jgi:hypothetical protein
MKGVCPFSAVTLFPLLPCFEGVRKQGKKMKRWGRLGLAYGRVFVAAAAAVIALALSGPALAQTAGAGLQAYVGTWKINPAKTRMGVNGPSTPTPLRDPTFTWIFTGKPYGLQMDVYTKYPQPAPSRTLTINPDGKIQQCQGPEPCLPSGGDPKEQSYSYHKLHDRMISRQFYVKGKNTESDTYTVSEDGKTLVIIAWHAETPEYQNVQVFDKQP